MLLVSYLGLKGKNLFEYCNGNPILKVDYSGFNSTIISKLKQVYDKIAKWYQNLYTLTQNILWTVTLGIFAIGGPLLKSVLKDGFATTGTKLALRYQKLKEWKAVQAISNANAYIKAQLQATVNFIKKYWKIAVLFLLTAVITTVVLCNSYMRVRGY